MISAVTPPTSGAYAGDANAVEVNVQEDLPRMFTALFADGDVEVAGRAVALVGAGQQTCVLALDDTASGAVTFTGSTGAILVGCNVHANSLSETGVVVSGSAEVETPCLSSSGGVSVTEGLTLTECAVPYINADQAPDPYADLPVPDTSQPATTPNVFGGGAGATYDITPGRYQGMDIRRTVNMAPGVYVIDGGSLSVNSTATVNGSGVTFYLTNGATLSMNGGANVDLSAPTAGTYSGVLVFVDRDEPFNDYTVNGNSGSTVNGAIYAANGHVRMNGSSTFGGGCTQIVARTIEFSGSAGHRRRLHRVRASATSARRGWSRWSSRGTGMRTVQPRCRRLRADARGVAAIEFAIGAPVLILGRPRDGRHRHVGGDAHGARPKRALRRPGGDVAQQRPGCDPHDRARVVGRPRRCRRRRRDGLRVRRRGRILHRAVRLRGGTLGLLRHCRQRPFEGILRRPRRCTRRPVSRSADHRPAARVIAAFRRRRARRFVD